MIHFEVVMVIVTLFIFLIILTDYSYNSMLHGVYSVYVYSMLYGLPSWKTNLFFY